MLINILLNLLLTDNQILLGLLYHNPIVSLRLLACNWHGIYQLYHVPL